MFKLSQHDGYLCVLRGAVSVDGATAAILFSTEPDRALTLEADFGATPQMLAFARSLAPGDGSATGNAVAQRHRVVIRDVATDYANSRRKQAALDAGIQAVTATPLIDSRLRVLGVLTLFYPSPHHPSYDAIRRLDGCCKVGSQLLEVFALQDRLGAAYSGADVRIARLSPTGRRAADAVARLLPVCGRADGDEMLFITLMRHLDLIIRELSTPV